MTLEEIKSKLCYNDTRNPIGISSYTSKEDLIEWGYSEKAQENCYCDNCFNNITPLAEELLKLKMNERIT